MANPTVNTFTAIGAEEQEYLMQYNKSFSTNGYKYALTQTCHTSVTFCEVTSALALGRKSKEKV